MPLPSRVSLGLCGIAVGLGLVLSMPASAAERAQELLDKTLKLTPNANRGSLTYAQNCAGCHGNEAWGRAESAVPALAGQRERYLLRQLIDFTEFNRESVEMHRMAPGLGVAPEQAWRDLAAHLARLPLNPRPQQGDGKSLDVGSGIYRDACAQCHGENGTGDDQVETPSVAGQHYSYLLQQTRAIATGHRFSNVEFDLALMLNDLSAAEMAAVADYMSRLSTRPTTAALGSLDRR